MQRKRVLAAGPNSATLLVHDTNANDLKVLKRINAASWSPAECSDALEVLHRNAEHPVPVMVSVEQAVIQNAFLNIVMPYFGDGCLADFMRDHRGTVPQKHIVQWVHVVALAVRSTHRLGSVHGNIRGTNVFLSSDRGAAGVIAGPPMPLVRYRERVKAAKKQHDLQGAAAIHIGNGANQSISGLSLELTFPPETLAEPFRYDAASDVWHLGALLMSLAGPQSLSSSTAESVRIRHLVNSMCDDDSAKRPSIDVVVRELHQLHAADGAALRTLPSKFPPDSSTTSGGGGLGGKSTASTVPGTVGDTDESRAAAVRSGGRLVDTGPQPSSSSPDPVRPSAATASATATGGAAAAETPSGIVVSPRRQRPSLSATTVGRNLPRTVPSSSGAGGGNGGAGSSAFVASADVAHHAYTCNTVASNTTAASRMSATRGAGAANQQPSRHHKPALASPQLPGGHLHELPQSSSSPTSPPSTTAARAAHLSHQAFLHAFLEDDNVEAQKRRDEAARELVRKREKHIVELRAAQQVHQQHSTNLRKIRAADNTARRDTIRQSIRLWQQQQPQQGASGGALLSNDDGVAIFAKAGPQLRPGEQRHRHYDFYQHMNDEQDGFDVAEDNASHDGEGLYEDRRDEGELTGKGGALPSPLQPYAETTWREQRECERTKTISTTAAPPTTMSVRLVRPSPSSILGGEGGGSQPHLSEAEQMMDSPLTAQGSASMVGDEYELSSEAESRRVVRRCGGTNTGGADPVRIEITPPRRHRGHASATGHRFTTGRVPLAATATQASGELKKDHAAAAASVDGRKATPLPPPPPPATPPPHQTGTSTQFTPPTARTPQQRSAAAASVESTALSLDASPCPSEGATRDTGAATATAPPETELRGSPETSSVPKRNAGVPSTFPSTSTSAPEPPTATDDIAAVAALEWSCETTTASLRRLFSSDDDPTLRKVAAEISRYTGLPPRHRCQATLAGALFNTVHRIVMETEGLSVAAGERAVLVASSAVQVAALDSVSALAAEFRGRPVR